MKNLNMFKSYPDLVKFPAAPPNDLKSTLVTQPVITEHLFTRVGCDNLYFESYRIMFEDVFDNIYTY